jgi:DNA-binding NtrC family response regulator
MQRRILIVDDEKTILFAMREYLAAYGYEVDCARDKREAEALLAERTYSVLITDLRLTGCEDMEGLEIIRSALEQSASIRSILLTAYGTPEVERAAYSGGVNAYLSKPRPLHEIAETVSRLLEMAR